MPPLSVSRTDLARLVALTKRAIEMATEQRVS
jgi:hypothetical protein